MKIEILTKASPGLLLTKIKKDIIDEKVKTWSVVKDSNEEDFFTHNPDQWFKKALLKPSIASNPSRLVLTITWFTNSIPTEYVKGLYVGRFTEVLLEHYRQDYSKLETFA